MSESGDYVGSAVTAIEEIEIFDYDEYVLLFGELPLDGIEEQDPTEPDDV